MPTFLTRDYHLDLKLYDTQDVYIIDYHQTILQYLCLNTNVGELPKWISTLNLFGICVWKLSGKKANLTEQAHQSGDSPRTVKRMCS